MAEKKKQTSIRLFEQITTVFLVLMSTVFLLAFDSTGYEKISLVKVTLFYALCGGYAGLVLLLLCECVLVGTLRVREVLRLLCPDTWGQRLALVYLGLTVVSALISPHASVWLGTTRHEGALSIALYVACFYFVSKFAVADQRLLYVFGGSVGLFCLIGILQLSGLDPFYMYPDGYNYFDADVAYSGAYLTTIGNVDFVAAFLCIAIPVLAVALLCMKEKVRFWLLLPLAMALWVLFQMGVLAGLVGVFGGVLVCLPVWLPLQKKGRLWLWCLLGAAAVAGVVTVYFVDIGDGLFHEIHLVLHEQGEDTFGSGRLYIWRQVWQRLKESIWFGHGPDTLSLAGIEPFRRHDASLGVTVVAAIDAAHNEYLGILYHQGVFALAAYLAVLGCGICRFVRHGADNMMTAMTGGAVIAYAVQAFFGISQPLTAPFFWLMLGLLIQNTDKKERKL